jgi:hypothetical protein
MASSSNSAGTAAAGPTTAAATTGATPAPAPAPTACTQSTAASTAGAPPPDKSERAAIYAAGGGILGAVFLAAGAILASAFTYYGAQKSAQMTSDAQIAQARSAAEAQMVLARSAFDGQMVQIGVNILSAEPGKADVTPARQWAIDLVEKHSGLPFNVADREALLHHPISSAALTLGGSLVDNLFRAFVNRKFAKRNADGSWTLTADDTAHNRVQLGSVMATELDKNCPPG